MTCLNSKRRCATLCLFGGTCSINVIFPHTVEVNGTAAVDKSIYPIIMMSNSKGGGHVIIVRTPWYVRTMTARYLMLSYIYYKIICSFCICDTDKSYVHVSRHSISKAVVQKLIKPISLPWEKKPYHQMIGSHTHVTHIIPREKKPYHQMIG